MRLYLARFPTLCLLALAIGCSQGDGRPKVVPVTGVVTYKSQPVEGAVVTFMSEGSPRTAAGITDAEGNFELSTYDTGDGAPVGEHVVTISKTDASAAAASTMDHRGYAAAMAAGKGGTSGLPIDPKAIKHTLPAKYANPKESGLKRQVIEGDTNHFKFDLTD